MFIMKKKIRGQKIMTFLSALYFLLLISNLFTAKLLPALVNLVMFVATCPIFFASFKENHSKLFKKIDFVLAIPIFITVLIFAGSITGMIAGTNEAIPKEEQNYIDTVLSQITTETTKEDAIVILGKPDRDLFAKTNWWVNIGGRNSRIGIYFSIATGTANEIVLDGGTGRFYYRKTLE